LVDIFPADIICECTTCLLWTGFWNLGRCLLAWYCLVKGH